MEGSATAMAYRAEYELGYINDYILDLKFSKAEDRCVHRLERQDPKTFDIKNVGTKNKHIYYDCGAVLLNLIVASHPDLTLFEFWKRLSITNVHAKNPLGTRTALAIKNIHIPNTRFLDELDLFLSDPVSTPREFLASLRALAAIPENGIPENTVLSID